MAQKAAPDGMPGMTAMSPKIEAGMEAISARSAATEFVHGWGSDLASLRLSLTSRSQGCRDYEYLPPRLPYRVSGGKLAQYDLACPTFRAS